MASINSWIYHFHHDWIIAYNFFIVCLYVFSIVDVVVEHRNVATNRWKLLKWAQRSPTNASTRWTHRDRVRTNNGSTTSTIASNQSRRSPRGWRHNPSAVRWIRVCWSSRMRVNKAFWPNLVKSQLKNIFMFKIYSHIL